jgi:hypothetical protein
VTKYYVWAEAANQAGLRESTPHPIGSATTPGPSYASDVAPIFAGSCTGCHTFDYASTVNASGACGTRVVPGSPSTSELYLLMAAQTSCGGYSVMPPSGGLSYATQVVHDWIVAGAPNN